MPLSPRRGATQTKKSTLAGDDRSKRQPLGELTPNARVSQPNLLGSPLKRGLPNSPLKRGSSGILDEDRGLKYFKRRKMSVPDQLGIPQVNKGGANLHMDSRVLAETVRFRVVPEASHKENQIVSIDLPPSASRWIERVSNFHAV